MRLYTALLKSGAEPVLVREGFSWGGLILGPFWLIAHRAWSVAAIALAAYVLIATLVPNPDCWILAAATSLILGMTGYDLRRWSLGTRGYLLVHVLAARSADAAFLRLLAQRPDLAVRFRPEPE